MGKKGGGKAGGKKGKKVAEVNPLEQGPPAPPEPGLFAGSLTSGDWWQARYRDLGGGVPIEQYDTLQHMLARADLALSELVQKGERWGDSERDRPDEAKSAGIGAVAAPSSSSSSMPSLSEEIDHVVLSVPAALRVALSVPAALRGRKDSTLRLDVTNETTCAELKEAAAAALHTTVPTSDLVIELTGFGRLADGATLGSCGVLNGGALRLSKYVPQPSGVARAGRISSLLIAQPDNAEPPPSSLTRRGSSARSLVGGYSADAELCAISERSKEIYSVWVDSLKAAPLTHGKCPVCKLGDGTHRLPYCRREWRNSKEELEEEREGSERPQGSKAEAGGSPVGGSPRARRGSAESNGSSGSRGRRVGSSETADAGSIPHALFCEACCDGLIGWFPRGDTRRARLASLEHCYACRAAEAAAKAEAEAVERAAAEAAAEAAAYAEANGLALGVSSVNRLEAQLGVDLDGDGDVGQQDEDDW